MSAIAKWDCDNDEDSRDPPGDTQSVCSEDRASTTSHSIGGRDGGRNVPDGNRHEEHEKERHHGHNRWSTQQRSFSRHSERRGRSQYTRGEHYNNSVYFETSNLRRQNSGSTQSLPTTHRSRKKEEVDGDVANDLRLLAVSAPEAEDGPVTYTSAGTAPAARIGSLQCGSPNTTVKPSVPALSAYAGGPDSGPIPAYIHPPLVTTDRYVEEEREALRNRPHEQHKRPLLSYPRKILMNGVEVGSIPGSSTAFFRHQVEEKNALMTLSLLSQLQQHYAAEQGLASLPRLYSDAMRSQQQQHEQKTESPVTYPSLRGVGAKDAASCGARPTGEDALPFFMDILSHATSPEDKTERPCTDMTMDMNQAGTQDDKGVTKGEERDATRSIAGVFVEESSYRHPTASFASNQPAEDQKVSRPPRAPPSTAVDVDGHFQVSQMDVLSEEIWHYHNSIAQTEQTLNRKLHLRDMLYYSICPVFPMCGLYVVGSSLNGFGNNSSDMDLCLMITNKDLDQKTDAVMVLNMIMQALRQVDWVAHQQLIVAKVPILRIRFTAPFADITVDLNANNSVAIKNTHLLCYYSSFDWRVRPLVTVVKEWAKRKGMNDANRSSFTSYSLVLMVIHYLQCGSDPAVLPSLQTLYKDRFRRMSDVRSLNVTLPLNPPSVSDWQFNEKATLGELLIGFLEYYALKFDYDRDAISVRLGQRIERALVARGRPGHFGSQQSSTWRSQWRCICIEEPFTQSNTAHSVYDEMVFSAIKEAFREGYEELEANRDLDRFLNCKAIRTAFPVGSSAAVFESVANGSSSSLNTAHSNSSSSSTCGEDPPPCGEDTPPSPTRSARLSPCSH